MEIKEYVERCLFDERNFRLVKDVRATDVPRRPGLYYIRLKEGSTIEDFSEEIAAQGHSVIYIGQASVSLFERFWEEELHHKRPGTFQDFFADWRIIVPGVSRLVLSIESLEWNVKSGVWSVVRWEQKYKTTLF